MPPKVKLSHDNIFPAWQRLKNYISILQVASTHAVLCLVSVGLMLLQVLMGFLRPNPDSTLRRLYNWTHSFFGFAAYVVAGRWRFRSLSRMHNNK